MLNVLVCGTNYGRVYLEAIAMRPRRYRLAGVLARGSARSREISRQCNSPLFTHVSELPASIDIACAAMGWKGREPLLELVRRGIHVLCEHPQPPEFLQTIYKVVRKSGTRFHLNAHFAYLDASFQFMKLFAQRRSAPRFIELTANDRCLYGVLDILKRVLGRLEPVSLDEIAGIPCAFRIQRSLQDDGTVLSDGSSSYMTDYRIDAGFRDGILSLRSMNGPVTWKDQVFPNRLPLREQRQAANLYSLNAIAKDIRISRADPDQRTEHVLEVCRVWQVIGQRIAHSA